MRALVTLTNDFHSTAFTLLASVTDAGEWRLSGHQVDKARRRLCSVEGCTCSDEAGTRGRQISEDGRQIDLTPNPDGSYTVEFVAAGYPD